MANTQPVLGMTSTGKPKKKPCCKGKKTEPWTDGALLTEYQKEYWEKRAPYQRQGATYPRTNLATGGAFEGVSCYTATYKGPQGERTLPFKPAPTEKENQPFSPWTTYKVDFPAKEVPYARVRPNHQLAPAEGPFVDATTMRTDYPGWMGAKPSTPAQGRAISVPRGVGPFEGLSSYKDDYRKWPGARPQPAAPLLGSNAALPRGAFDDTTTHRSCYTPKAVGPAERFHPQQQTEKPEGWFDGVPSTEYRRHYVEKDGGPQPRAGATTGASGTALPKGPFAGTSTYATEYRPRTAPAVERAGKPADDPKESGPFMGATTYGDSYVKKEAPYARVKPANSLQPSAGPFQDATENRQCFQDWGAQPVVRAGPNRAGNLASGGPFDGASTYKTDFHKMAGGLRASVGRPVSGHRGLRQPGPFQGISTYTSDYIPKPFDPSRSYRPGTCSSCDPASDCEDEP
ncbi:hypothetical protein HXX76_004946 [Chlamydomonas incerta]|uniref:Uncharacterized protein n=1 Tax=Chlamydomonas incerta TaxID=51695 RepID=A0A835TFY1_CHLIN|nr:hypothetical protein HXX76_004946 [Chlamydomonas incerta]|eukprot:KAG2439594.1 hypothetical protein HXX76_004946 [Chlamydomonas incerta]